MDAQKSSKMWLIPATCVLVVLIAAVESVQVKVEQGILEGEILTTIIGNRTYYSFKGIPYAAPPLCSLRFKAPRAPLKWKGIRKATKHGSVCVQHETPTSNNIIGDEDCLFLNVYSPNLNPNKPLAVMFFIHGGLFITQSGNTDLYGPDFLMLYDVVLVTINYRLDSLGFLSADTEQVPGNAGLKDQIAALKWVKRNIRCFGGDPDNVTIFGQSAGGVAVTLHLMSPAAKGLFHKAIGMSGAVCSDWSITFEHKKRAFALGRLLGLETSDANELIDFLQTVPAKKLVEVRPKIRVSDEIYTAVLKSSYFTPIVEKKFNENQYLTEHPADLLCAGRVNEVNFMTGHTQVEGLRSTALVIDKILTYYPQYEQLYVPIKISNTESPEKVLNLGDRIRNKYITNGTILDSIEGFVKHVSYSYFVNDINNFVEKYSKVSAKNIYFYLFSIYSTRNFYSLAAKRFGIYKATHDDDLQYLFNAAIFNTTVTENCEAFKYIDIMCRLYTNFAKTGNPTPENCYVTKWPTYGQKRNFVSISDTLTVGQVEYTGDLAFWQDIFKDAASLCEANTTTFSGRCVCSQCKVPGPVCGKKIDTSDLPYKLLW